MLVRTTQQRFSLNAGCLLVENEMGCNNYFCPCLYFLQDNAPSHTSNESRAWLHNNGIDCIDFPPYSPDLNPIENLWADLKRRVELRCPCDSTELKQFLTEEWTATDPEYLRCLTHFTDQSLQSSCSL